VASIRTLPPVPVPTSFAPGRRSVDLAMPDMAPATVLVPAPELEALAETVTATMQPTEPAAKKAAAEPAPPPPAPAAESKPAAKRGRPRKVVAAAPEPAPVKARGRRKSTSGSSASARA